MFVPPAPVCHTIEYGVFLDVMKEGSAQCPYRTRHGKQNA